MSTTENETRTSVAVVCGSDTPVGDALVTHLHATGTEVITVDAPGTASHPAAHLRLQGHLRDESTWEDTRTTIGTSRKVLNAFIHIASVSEGSIGPLELPAESWDKVLDQDLRSAYLACRCLMPVMESEGGAVVLLGSVYGTRDTRAEAAAFSASQAGLLALTRSLALSGAPLRVRVNVVCTGLLRDPKAGLPQDVLAEAARRVPLGKLTEPEEVVDAIMFLLSPDAAYLTGSELVVDGGQSLQSWSNAPEDGYGD